MAVVSSAGGSAKQKRNRDIMRAAYMKQHGVCRTTGRCAQCYRIVTIESWKSRYTHICR